MSYYFLTFKIKDAVKKQQYIPRIHRRPCSRLRSLSARSRYACKHRTAPLRCPHSSAPVGLWVSIIAIGENRVETEIVLLPPPLAAPGGSTDRQRDGERSRVIPSLYVLRSSRTANDNGYSGDQTTARKQAFISVQELFTQRLKSFYYYSGSFIVVPSSIVSYWIRYFQITYKFTYMQIRV